LPIALALKPLKSCSLHKALKLFLKALFAMMLFLIGYLPSDARNQCFDEIYINPLRGGVLSECVGRAYDPIEMYQDFDEWHGGLLG
jgi:hypothetical protein